MNALRYFRSATLGAIGIAALIPSGRLWAQSTYATPYTVSTLAGSTAIGSANGSAAAARFYNPMAVASDSSGNLYVSDDNYEIRTISTSGIVAPLAGNPGNPGTADGTGAAAQFELPWGTVVDNNGIIYVSDFQGQTIRKISSGGVVTTLAGSPLRQGSTDGTGSAARFQGPAGIAVDTSGNIYVADSNNNTIRKVTPAGVVITVAGQAGVTGSTDGPASTALFKVPYGVAVDGSGNIYVADTGNRTIRKITSAGVVSTIAGTTGVGGSADGIGRAAQFSYPWGIATDSSGNVYVADTGANTIRKISPAGVVTTLAGLAGTAGATDGIGPAALLNGPDGIALDSSGNLYIADSGNNEIRKAQAATSASPTPPAPPTILTQPGQVLASPGSTATFSVQASGSSSLTYQWLFNGSNLVGATSATLTISNVQFTNAGNYSVVISNGVTSVASKSAALGILLAATPAPSPVTYTTSSLASTGTTSGPNGIILDSAGNAYVSVGNAIEKISPSGVPSIFAGSLTATGSADGVGSAALFNQPAGLAIDNSGTLYVADTGNNAIRKILPNGTVSTLAGLIQGNADGVGIAAEFNQPLAVAVDASGNVYVADTGNNELRKITANGTTTTLLSTSSFAFANVPYPAVYAINGVAVDSSGAPYVGVSATIGFGHGDFPANEVAVIKVGTSGTYTQLFIVNDSAGIISPTTGDGAVTIDPSGNVYVLSGHMIFEGNDQIGQTGVVSLAPTAIASDAYGRIFEANPGNHNVLIVTPQGTAPTISAQPSSVTIAYGAATTLSVMATGTPAPTYQWQLNGTNIPGATSATYTTSAPGTYTVVITNAAGSVTSSPVAITAATRLINISTRAQVGTGGNILIAGFVVSGPPGSTEPVLVRGVGPGLTQFGVTGILNQPVLSLYNSSGQMLATNTGWNTNANASQIAAAATTTGAFQLALGSADCALLTNLAPGAYTAEISGAGNTTGTALAEVYEVSSGNPELINISTRAYVPATTGVEIAGLVISGSQPAKVLIRAVGPTLTQFGVSGVLAQPTLSVVNSIGQTIATNSGWSTNANAATIASETAAVGAFALPSGSADCAVLVTLAPGSYTALVQGLNGTSGVALIEAYQAP